LTEESDDSSWAPMPQTSGDLGKPPRLPPTAVGLLTPPPPAREPRAKRYFTLSRTRIVATVMLGGLFVAAGPVAAALTESLVGLFAGSTSVIIGGSVWYRIARTLRNVRFIAGEARYVGSVQERRAA
jgi:hypothetical protein